VFYDAVNSKSSTHVAMQGLGGGFNNHSN